MGKKGIDYHYIILIDDIIIKLGIKSTNDNVHEREFFPLSLTPILI